jgi:hypothetical protein
MEICRRSLGLSKAVIPVPRGELPVFVAAGFSVKSLPAAMFPHTRGTMTSMNLIYAPADERSGQKPTEAIQLKNGGSEK